MLVHAENDAILRAGIDRMRSAGRRDLRAHLEARPAVAEEEAAHRALYLARHCGARLQVVHTSSPVTVDLVSAARAHGQVATAEVCGHHLLLDADDFLRIGPAACCAPPLRDRPLVEQMWERVRAGEIDCLVSDHGAYTVQEKRRGLEDIFEAPLGCQDVQETVPAVLSEAHHRRGMALDAFARFSSTNAAKIAGLYPRKGTILPGSQADLVVWDLAGEWTVDASVQQFSKNPWSPYDGRRLRARVLRTIVAGQTVFADGQILVEPGHGQFVSRAEPAMFGDARAVSKYHHPEVREPLSSAGRTGQTTGADRGG